MQRKISTVITGGSYFAIGYASAHPDCMILESSQILGIDFHRGLRTADLSSLKEKESDTELAKLMVKYHAWEGNRFDILKAAPVLHEYCRQKQWNIVLDAKFLGAEKEADGFCVRYITNSGIHEIHCRNLLDATILRDTYPEGKYCKAKQLNLFTVSLEDGFEEKLYAVAPECVIEDGLHPGEKFIRIPFPAEKRLIEAYEEVTTLWKKAFPKKEEKILFIAQDFDYHCGRKGEEKAPCPWIRGDFANPLSAYAAGTEYEL